MKPPMQPSLARSLATSARAALLGLLLASVSGAVLAASPPSSAKDRLWLRTSYLEQPEEGIYEVQYNPRVNLVFASVMDRVRREQNIGYLYAFDPASLQVKARYRMPYRAFSLTQDAAGQWLYVGHTQAASLRISKVSPEDGTVALTSERLHMPPAEPKDEHLRHLVHSSATNELFVTYIARIKDGEKSRTVYRLLVVDDQTLSIKGEVEGAYPSIGYSLLIDRKRQRIYTSGNDYINEIDPVSRKVVRSFDLKSVEPPVNNLVELAVDSDGGRIFAAQFIHVPNKEAKGEQDGVYVFDLKDGKLVRFIPTGKGVVAIGYNPKHDEIYASNFRSHTISVVDGRSYEISKQIPVFVFPNMMTQASDWSALFVGIKQGFSRQWNPEEFVEGAKEQILRISLDRDAAAEKAASKP